jgi:hypothetical protein
LYLYSHKDARANLYIWANLTPFSLEVLLAAGADVDHAVAQFDGKTSPGRVCRSVLICI